MPFLLDTHVILWYVTGSPSLSLRAKAIVDAKSDLFLSVVSLWEITIKMNIGKLQLDCSFDSLLAQIAVMRAGIIPIEIANLEAYINLPFPSSHRDPFDRMLITQAMNYSLDIVSADAAFDAYPIQRVWI